MISTLIGAGIEIHSVAENQILRSDDPVGAIMSTIYLMRANNESVIKSERAKKGYEKRLNESITALLQIVGGDKLIIPFY